MPLTETERRVLRQRCPRNVSGFRRLGPAEEFARIATWCAINDIAHDHYGSGPLVEDFEAKIATLLGRPSAVFMPSGVMAQLATIRIWCDQSRIDRFGAHPTSHLLRHEEEAYAALMRLHAVPVGDRLAPMTAADLDAIRQPLACLLVELPIREAGGQLPSWEALDALKRAARERGVTLHMDGARLWECAPFYGRSYAEIADGFDSVYVSLYKHIGGFAGSVLVGEPDFVAQARLWRRRMGGTLYRLGPLVASAAMQFDERIALMPALYQRTLTFAAGLSKIPDIRITPDPPHVNMLHLHFDAAPDALLDARDRIATETGTWLLDHVRASEIPGWSTSELSIGDQLLTIDDAALMPLFARLVEEAG